MWEVERHLAFMDKMGIETSVLTLPAPLPFYGDREKSREIVRKANRAFHDIRARYPGRFLFCASLPLPDVEGALDEARYALEELRADGIRLATTLPWILSCATSTASTQWSSSIPTGQIP